MNHVVRLTPQPPSFAALRSLVWSTPRRRGLLTAALIALTVTLSLSWPLLSFGQTEYTAQFARAAGLKSGDDVRIAGISVGKVRAVELAGDHVDVRFTVDDDVELGADTRAEVKLGTLLGSTFLSLDPAGPGALDNGVIPLRNTFTTFQVQEVVEGAGRSASRLDAQALRKALGAVTDTLPDHPGTVRRTLDGLGRISEIVTARDTDLEQLLTSATSVATLLRKHGDDVTTLMSEADTLLRSLLARKQAVHDILVHVQGMSRNLSALIRENSADLKPLLDRLAEVTAVLERRDDELDRGLRILGPTTRYLVNATGNGPYLDGALPYAMPDNVLCAASIVEGCR